MCSHKAHSSDSGREQLEKQVKTQYINTDLLIFYLHAPFSSQVHTFLHWILFVERKLLWPTIWTINLMMKMMMMMIEDSTCILVVALERVISAEVLNSNTAHFIYIYNWFQIITKYFFHAPCSQKQYCTLFILIEIKEKSWL